MTVRGKWRILEVPSDKADYSDMMGPAYIFFDGKGGGEFPFGCVTASLYGAADANAVDFTWDGNDEMDEAFGDGSAQLRTDGSLKAEICFHRGDQIAFTDRPWQTSSTAC